jgi:hypothetical protein
VAVAALVALPTPGASAGAAAPLAPAASTPDARLGLWLGALQQLLERHPDLTPDQADAVWKAVRTAGPELFPDSPGTAERETLVGQLTTLRGTLSCAQFHSVLAGLEGLQEWMERNEVVVAPPTCNCGADDDCGEGYTCKAIECVSETGTTHWGVCREKKTAVPGDPEPLPR